MKSKPYSVVGNKRDGHRIAVPECVGAKAGDRYNFKFLEKTGTLVFTPAAKETEER